MASETVVPMNGDSDAPPEREPILVLTPAQHQGMQAIYRELAEAQQQVVWAQEQHRNVAERAKALFLGLGLEQGPQYEITEDGRVFEREEATDAR